MILITFHDNNIAAVCVCVFFRCGRSAVYRTREMAARALVPFVLVTQVPSTVQALLQELPPEPGPKIQHNHIHGTLLQVCTHTQSNVNQYTHIYITYAITFWKRCNHKSLKWPQAVYSAMGASRGIKLLFVGSGIYCMLHIGTFCFHTQMLCYFFFRGLQLHLMIFLCEWSLLICHGSPIIW